MKVSYPEERLRGMSAVQLWVELGFHKGFIGYHPKDQRTAFYYLGSEELVGWLHSEGRSVLDAAQLDGHVVALLPTYKPSAPWEGPAMPRKASLTAEKQRQMEDALRTINGRHRTNGKPALKLKDRIAQEDAPDFGRTLMYHAGTRTYRLVSNPKDAHELKSKGCFDVTGVEKHESAYAALHASTKPRLKPTFRQPPPPKPRLNLRNRP